VLGSSSNTGPIGGWTGRNRSPPLERGVGTGTDSGGKGKENTSSDSSELLGVMIKAAFFLRGGGKVEGGVRGNGLCGCVTVRGLFGTGHPLKIKSADHTKLLVFPDNLP